MTHLLVIEDDLALSDVILFTLRRAGFAVTPAFDGEAALAAYAQAQPDLVLLDLNLPKLDGLAVCRQLRAQGSTPIIMLSVRNQDETIVQGLEMGADDYIVKPFSPTQLVARVRAVLRRAQTVPTAGNLSAGTLVLDRQRHEVQLPQTPESVGAGAARARLTPLEVKLLETLMLHTGQVLPADLLINAVWGIDGGDRAMLKQLIYRLRSKLDEHAPDAVQIETVPGVGYVLHVPL